MTSDGNSPKKQASVNHSTKQERSGDEENKEENAEGYTLSTNVDDEINQKDDDEDEVDKRITLPQAQEIERVKQTVKVRNTYLNHAVRYLQTFSQSLGGTDSSIPDIVYRTGKVVKYDQDKKIIEKGDDCKGFFIVIGGAVDVTTSDNNDIISTLRPSDIFGDLSTLFNLPCTANVIARAGTTLVAINKNKVEGLFQSKLKNIDVIDWCIKRRYLPTSDVIDSARAYRRMAFQFLKSLPLFCEWPDNVTKSLVLTFEHSLVTLYPQNALIVLEGDPLNSLYVIIKGTFSICRDSREITTVNVSSDSDPFVFGELGILLESRVSAVTMQAVEACLVIQVRKEWILKTLSLYPGGESKFLHRTKLTHELLESMGHLYGKYEAYLQLEVLCHYLKSSKLYTAMQSDILQEKLMSGALEENLDFEDVILNIDEEMYESMLVILGEVAVKPKIKQSNDEPLKGNSLQQNGDDLKDNKTDVIESENEHHRDNSVYTDGSVIEIKGKRLYPILVRSPCLVFKIQRHGIKISAKETIVKENLSNSLEFV